MIMLRLSKAGEDLEIKLSKSRQITQNSARLLNAEEDQEVKLSKSE